MKHLLVMMTAAAMIAGCENDARDGADGDSTSRFERGVERVGEKIESAAKDVGVEVRESRIQMVIDNIRGMDSVQAELTTETSVTLIGSVASDEDRRRAEELVRSIEGVETVQNSQTVGGVAADTAASATPIDTTR